jgi:putative ABC transport system permease protein
MARVRRSAAAPENDPPPGGGTAIGSSSVYIHKVIICQALLKTADTALPVVMRPGLTLRLFLLTVAVCVISAIAAIVQVTRIDPAMVFMR